MPISSSESSKIRKFGTKARKALRKRLYPILEASTRIAEASDPSMSPKPEAFSGLDTQNSNGKNPRDGNSDEKQNSSKKARPIKTKLTYMSGRKSPKFWSVMVIPWLILLGLWVTNGLNKLPSGSIWIRKP